MEPSCHSTLSSAEAPDRSKRRVALIIVDYGNVGRWAEKRGIGYTTFVDLSQKPEVYQLIEEAGIEGILEHMVLKTVTMAGV